MLPHIKILNSSAKVLVVDDDSASRNLLRINLEELGYTVTMAVDGEEAIEKYELEQFDIVLIDQVMPGMDGVECVKKFKKIKKDSYIPVLFVTANTNPSTVETCIREGGDDVIFKPFEQLDLKLKLHSWLRMKAAFEQLTSVKNELYKISMQNEIDLHDAKEIIEIFNQYNKDENPNITHIEYPENIVSGDICMISKTPLGNQYALLGDFTGHGLPAGIGAMIVSQVFYTMTNKGFSINEIAAEINKKLLEVLPVNRFMAGCFIEINYSEMFATVLNAGMPDVFVFNQNKEHIKCIASENIPFGIHGAELSQYQSEYVDIKDGDSFILYSDGLTETLNHQSKMFGTQGLLSSVSIEDKTKPIFKDILNAYHHFKSGEIPADDVSLLHIEILSQCNLIASDATSQCKRTPSSWDLHYEFDEWVMREIDPIPSLVNYLIDIQGVNLSREKLFIVLTELYSNSLEHGILGLDSNIKNSAEGFESYYQQRDSKLSELASAKISLHFKHRPTSDGGKLEIQLTDSGAGFDVNKVGNTYEKNLEYKGRGIQLVKNLCDYCSYEQDGTQVNVHLHWKMAA